MSKNENFFRTSYELGENLRKHGLFPPNPQSFPQVFWKTREVFHRMECKLFLKFPFGIGTFLLPECERKMEAVLPPWPRHPSPKRCRCPRPPDGFGKAFPGSFLLVRNFVSLPPDRGTRGAGGGAWMGVREGFFPLLVKFLPPKWSAKGGRVH